MTELSSGGAPVAPDAAAAAASAAARSHLRPVPEPVAPRGLHAVAVSALPDVGFVGIAEVSLDGLLDANDTLLQLLGYRLADVAVGGTVEWHGLTPRVWGSADRQALAQMIEHGRSEPYEKEFLDSTGEPVPVRLAIVLLERQPLRWLSLVQDLRPLRAAEQAESALAEAQRVHGQLARLQEITDAALGSLSLDDLLDELMERLRHTLRADTVRILLLSEDGTQLSGGGVLGQGLDVRDDVPIPVGAGFAGRIASTLEPLVVPDARQWRLVSPLLRWRVRSLAGVPMLAAGRLVGVLHVGTVDERHFDDSDVELLQLAADRIGVAIERARSYDFEHRARERFEFVTAVNDALARSLDQREIMQFVTRAAVPRLGDWALLYVLPPHGDAMPAFELAHMDGAREAYARDAVAAAGWRADAPFGPPAVVRTGRREWHREVPAAHERLLRATDERLEKLLAFGVTSSLIVPLRARDRVVGALQLSMAESDRRFSLDDVELAEDVAARVAAALENARLFEEQRSIAVTLQRSLLPDRLPEVPGLGVAVRYRPAAGGEVGGDFYDLKEVGDGSWIVTIGDVAGKGIPAAAVTSLARHTLAAVSPLDPAPSAGLRRLHRELLARRSEQYCTAVAVTLRPRPAHAGGGFDVRLAAGGHPLPVLVPADGSGPRFVGRFGTILGFVEPVRLHDVDLALEPGDTLVLYTDGATDLPAPGAVDEETLLAMVAAAAMGENAEAVGSALDAALAARHEGVVHRDDLALVVLRVS